MYTFAELFQKIKKIILIVIFKEKYIALNRKIIKSIKKQYII